MASGICRRTGEPLEGWPYTVQCLEVANSTKIGTRIMREYLGSLGADLLVRENLTESALSRWIYAQVLTWHILVPMFKVERWQPVGTGEERSGVMGIDFYGAHFPNAHLGDFALESNRVARANLASQAIEIFSAPSSAG